MNESSDQKIESIQYNACLAITSAIRDSSREKIYQELGVESLQHRRWYRKLCYFFKIYNTKSPDYLFQLIPLKTLIIFHSSNFAIIFFKTRFSRPLLLNGTNQLLILEIRTVLALLKKYSKFYTSFSKQLLIQLPQSKSTKIYYTITFGSQSFALL